MRDAARPIINLLSAGPILAGQPGNRSVLGDHPQVTCEILGHGAHGFKRQPFVTPVQFNHLRLQSVQTTAIGAHPEAAFAIPDNGADFILRGFHLVKIGMVKVKQTVRSRANPQAPIELLKQNGRTHPVGIATQTGHRHGRFI